MSEDIIQTELQLESAEAELKAAQSRESLLRAENERLRELVVLLNDALRCCQQDPMRSQYISWPGISELLSESARVLEGK